MEMFLLGGILVFIALVTFFRLFPPVTIYEYERGLLFTRGILNKTLSPGRYRFYKETHRVIKVDIRLRTMSIPGSP